MALKKTTMLKRKIDKRTKLIDDSTRELLKVLSNVTDGADIFFKESMPNHNIKVEWSDIEMTEHNHVLIKGVLMTGESMMSAANVMVIHVPIEMASGCTAREVADYMIETSGQQKKPKKQAEAKPAPTLKDDTQEFDLTVLSKEQLHQLRMFNLSRGGKL